MVASEDAAEMKQSLYNKSLQNEIIVVDYNAEQSSTMQWSASMLLTMN